MKEQVIEVHVTQNNRQLLCSSLTLGRGCLISKDWVPLLGVMALAEQGLFFMQNCAQKYRGLGKERAAGHSRVRGS